MKKLQESLQDFAKEKEEAIMAAGKEQEDLRLKLELMWPIAPLAKEKEESATPLALMAK